MVPPFTLVWHDAETARRALAGVVEDPEEGLTYFEEIVRRSNVTAWWSSSSRTTEGLAEWELGKALRISWGRRCQ